MDSNRYQRIKQLFDEAVDLPPAQCAAFLRAQCGGDEQLQREVLELLEADQRSGEESLDRAVAQTLDDKPPALPERIGRYRVLSVCGVGGMGTVYEAEQSNPARRVAVKVIQLAMARPELRKRFQREAEILGRLQHAGIAQIFEAGEFEQDGGSRPFFAMEYVEGPNVVDYVRQRALAVDPCVDLFVQICEAVHHAHQHGVVHRDLKPDNILVVEQSGALTSADACVGQPKVLDFGVARLVDADDALTIATGEGQLVGSLPYMSPEQAVADSAAIDARCDVYALGVVLYELLTQRLPYDVRGKPLAEAVRIIQEVEPTRLGTAVGALRGDLETIVGRCLEKDRSRRYESALALAEDLRRYRESMPIHARPPSAFYQLRKFARRHRALVAGVLATMLSLAIGLVVAVQFALQSADNERLALRQADRANITAADSLLAADPLAARAVLERVPVDRRAWEWRYLDASLRPQIAELGEVHASSPLVSIDDGRQLLVAGDATTLRLLDVDSGDVRTEWRAPGEAVAWAVAADGARFAVALVDGRVFVSARTSPPSWQLWRTCEDSPSALRFAPMNGELAVFVGNKLHLGSPRTTWRMCELGARARNEGIAFAPGGERVAVATQAGYVLVFSTADLNPVARRYDTDDPRSLAYSNDGQLVIGMFQRLARFADPDTTKPKPQAQLAGHSGPIVSVACDHQGRVLTASRDGTVRVWAQSRECTAVMPVEGITSANFLSPDRIVCIANGRLHVIGLDADRRRVLRGHHGYVYEVAFSADGSLLATDCPFPPYELAVWRAFTGEQVSMVPGHWKTSSLTMDGRGRVRTGEGLTIDANAWYAAARAAQTPIPGFHLSWSFRPKVLRSSHVRSAWPDASKWRSLRSEYGRAPGTHQSIVRVFADGDEVEGKAVESVTANVLPGARPRLFVGSAGDELTALHGDMGDLVVFGGWLSPADAAAVDDYVARRKRGHDVDLPAVASAELLAHFRACADDLQLAPGATRTVLAWRAHNDPGVVLKPYGCAPERVCWMPADEDGPDRVHFHNGRLAGRWLEAALPSAANRERMTIVWAGSMSGSVGSGNSGVCSLRTMQLVGEQSYQPDTRLRRIGAAASRSADGRRIAKGGTYGGASLIVRDTATGDVLREFVPVGEADTYWGVSMHPSGRWVAAGSDRGSLDVWDVDNGELLGTVAAHVRQVFAVAWSPDGARIATGGNDNAIRLWDAKALAPVLTLRGHDTYIKALAWSPDGSMIASASGDGTARVWDSFAVADRHAAAQRQREREQQVRAQVAQWLDELGDKLAVGERIATQFADREALRLAAFTVLAGLQK